MGKDTDHPKISRDDLPPKVFPPSPEEWQEMHETLDKEEFKAAAAEIDQQAQKAHDDLSPRMQEELRKIRVQERVRRDGPLGGPLGDVG